MPSKSSLRIFLFCVALVYMLASAIPGTAQNWTPYTGTRHTAHVVSDEARSLPSAPAHVGSVNETPSQHRPSFVPSGVPGAPDPALQKTPGSALATTSGNGFDGVLFNGYYPADPNLSVGQNQIVQTTNVEFSIYDKSGTLLKGSVLYTTLFSNL